MNHIESLLITRFWFNKSGWGLKLCILNNLGNGTFAASLVHTLYGKDCYENQYISKEDSS